MDIHAPFAMVVEVRNNNINTVRGNLMLKYLTRALLLVLILGGTANAQSRDGL